jgi:hypothetical protein
MPFLSQSFHARRAARFLDNRIMRRLFSFGVLAAAIACPPVALIAQDKSPAPKTSVAGAWTRNADLSDKPAGRGGQGDDSGVGGSGRQGGSGGGRRRGGGGGGFGGGYGRGGGMGRGGDAGRANPEEMMRIRDALRDITNPSDHLTITQTESMVVVTGADGRTTRLSPDGKKIKDDNTKVERKTRWDGGKLVSEISGLGSGKMTQTFAVDPESKQLRIVVVMEGGRSGEPRTITQVYDADAR